MQHTADSSVVDGVVTEMDAVQLISSFQEGLHGRRQIYTETSEITDRNVIDILVKAVAVHQQNRVEEIYLERYLRGFQPVLERYKKYNSEINNKIVVNLANMITAFKTAEFAGEPIQYISRGSKSGVTDKVGKLNDMMLSEGKQSKDFELAYRMFTGGVGYRLVIHDTGRDKTDYLDEAPFEIYIPDPWNTFIVRVNDVTKKPVMGVTYVYPKDQGGMPVYTVYTKNVTYTIASGGKGLEIKDKTVHNFGLLNMIEYPCNSIRMGAFEVVLPLMDAYNNALSNRLDGIEQFIQALMVFDGIDVEREDLENMKDLGAVKLPPSNSGGGNRRLYYLNEQLDQSQTQTLVNDMYRTILQIVGVPAQGDGTTGDSSNNGAAIMKNGWWHAEARAQETQNMWKASETEFLKVVLKICADTNTLTGLKVSDVEPKFWRQSYEDLLVKTQSFSTLRTSGMPAIQAFTFSHLSRDPESDAETYDKYQEELAAELDRLNGVAGEDADGVPLREDTTEDPTTPEGIQASAEVEESSSGGRGKSSGEWAICPVCGKRFKKSEPGQIYSSIACANKARKLGGSPRYGGAQGR